MSTNDMPTLLIDGDLLLYKATSASENEIRWDEDNHVLYSSVIEAYEMFVSQLNAIKTKLDSSQVRIAFTKGASFRSKLYEPYKAPRQGTRKPLCFARVRDRIESEFPCYSYPGLEADDVLGIWATNGNLDNCIVVSEDKDLKTVPCKLYRQNELTQITEEEADWNFMFQTVTGDVTDGYPGCPGIGPKTAEKLFGETKDLGELWLKVVAAYEHAKLTEEQALTQARMARILRASDWDAAKKEVKLWLPPVTA
jgi:DNA polymerase-1